ncbi:MAG: site-2 protease family protein [Methanobacteriota archaeon]|nr:MAG: site-2 protease family protein [Euryarchaeota archaeon]
MNGYLIALIVFLAWLALVIAARKKGWLQKRSMSLWGPIVMWRTRKGREFIDRLASRRGLWGFFGKASLWICATAMITMMVLLLWQATIVPQIERPPSPKLILGVPGINPVIPVGYGILGLAVAMIVHEFSHGVMTRIAGMKISSLGLLFLVFPIGAFVEPDEKALQETTRSKRAKVFGAGPASNLILAVIMLGIFSGLMMSSLDPAHEGPLVTGVVEDSPAAVAGLAPYSVLVSIDGVALSSPEDVGDRESSPGSTVDISYYLGGELKTAEDVLDGVVVAYVVKDFAAHEAGLGVGMLLISLNDTEIDSMDRLTEVMSETTAGQVVNVTVMAYDPASDAFEVVNDVSEIVLSDKHDYYSRFYPDENDPAYAGRGYLGGGFIMLGLESRNPEYYADMLARPFQGDRTIGDFSMSWLRLIALPFLDLAPLRSPVTDLYEAGGALSWIPDDVFWILTNSVYWIFWLNLMLGLTNVLPAVPLDGGYLFRDGMDYVLARASKESTKEQRDRVTSSLTLALAFLVLFLILWQLIGPAF